MHESFQGKQSGVNATLKRVSSLFYWPHLRTEVVDYIRQCTICQQCKADLGASPGLLQPPPIPEAIWENIHGFH